jgi:electron transport complex protein RnfA
MMLAETAAGSPEIGYLSIAIGLIFVSNFVLAKFLGLCPFIGVTKRSSDAIGMGLAVMFVMTMAVFVTTLLHKYVLAAPADGGWNLLVALGITTPDRMGGHYVLIFKTVSYILIIAVLVQFVEMVLKKSVPVLYKALGIYLPLITTNCTVLGVTLLATSDWKYPNSPLDLPKACWMGLCGGAGFTLAMILMSGIRERLATSRVPRALQNVPIAFISTGLMALAFLGFSKLFGIQL